MILADGQDVRHLVPEHDPRVRLIHLDGWPEIGAKRNFGCEHAEGEIIAHWDDDDYSAPGRLADQVERLRESGKAVTGFHSMRFTDGVHWWKYEGTRNYALGTRYVTGGTGGAHIAFRSFRWVRTTSSSPRPTPQASL